ncbi:hypothetical protein [Actinocrispum sp. NPDC049592]|uniref:TetR/AcrR family transcriptional regulator n=1 Tax=Actinocrispum sp. NPDC049592 TaxID=3154835 RepID=UPI0034336421
MPANPERRALIADTAITLIAENGAGGLTHRAVDVRADLPTGTTSNFFRTRLALLEAAAERVAELHWGYIGTVRSGLSGRADVAKLLSRMVAGQDEVARVRNLARFELFLAGNREPSLRPMLAEIHAAAIQGATEFLLSAGVPATPDRARLLSQVLTGMLFDNLTMPPAAPDPVFVERMLELVFYDTETRFDPHQPASAAPASAPSSEAQAT